MLIATCIKQRYSKPMQTIESDIHLRQERIWIDILLDINFLRTLAEVITVRRLKTKRVNFSIYLIDVVAIGIFTFNFNIG